DNTDFKTPVVRINCIQDSWFGRKTAITSGKLLAGKYTLSFKYRTNATINNTFIGYGGNQRRRLITSNVVGNETWQTCKLTFETTEDYPDIFIIIGGYGKADVSYIEFAELKLEKGAIATDWTPAPEDIESSIEAGKALISQVSNAVADVNGKLSATHTLKTQVISGGRTAIAGIALGATSDNKTAESSVIVMADKFGVVANANDGNVKPLFSVANDLVGIRGDMIADGSILGEKIRANSTLSAPNINGGNISGTNIRGTTINGGTITGTAVSGGTVTGAIVSGGTVKGSRIEGGVISGSTILGDIVKAVILTKKGNNFEGTVPASEISSRTVVIPSISFNANSGETSTVTIYIDGIKVAESSVSGIRKEIPIMATIAPTEIRGSVSVSVSGDVGGDLSGQVSGSVSGQASGMVSGQASGTVSGNVNGFVNGGYVSGQVSGMASGHLSGTASGSLSGQVSGAARGRATGRVTGTATGFATGTTPMTNIRTSFMLEVPTSGSISGYKQITGKSVIIKVTANNATALGGQNSLVALVA
ncbi:TPA: DUF1983 domain-containing protein, partial [Mannheimia haemolytica]|nr:DUF1983 domain-containing protein [Mannheimia haemolytica]